MLFKIAWRNIWRSKVRSFVVIGAVVVGIWSLIFLMSFSQGMVLSYISNAIQYQTSHIQIHHPQYKDERELKFDIANASDIVEQLKADENVVAMSSRILVNGMLSTANGVRGGIVKAVDAKQEIELTTIDTKLLEGTFLESKSKNPIVVSEAIAEKLKLKLRSKVVMNFQKLNGELTAAAFRVVGIYKSGNRQMDELYSFTRLEDIQRLAEIEPGRYHEIAYRIADIEVIDDLTRQYKSDFSSGLVESYKELSPDLELFNSQIRLNLIIMTTIVMLALVFGIINTMLMAVLERVRELGMLMAIGMNKVRVFFMIVIETIMVSIIGAPIGLILGYLTVKGLHKTGIDLSQWSDGLEKFGMSTIMRPVIQNDAYWIIMLAIIFTAIIGSIYPALKAIRMKPVEALRKL